MKPTRSEIFGMRKNRHAEPLTGHCAAVVAPLGRVSPNLFFVLAAFRVENFSIAGWYLVLRFASDAQRCRDAETKTHFLLISKIELLIARERRVPQQQIPS